MSVSAADIDRMLAADKALFGVPEWQEAGAVASLVSSVVNETGGVVGGLSLCLSVNIETMVQRGDAVLVFDRVAIQRLAYRPDKFHVNPGQHPVPTDLRRLRLPPDRTRFYQWTDNRVWPRPARQILAGRIVDAEPATVSAAIDLFVEACGITAYLPAPPWRPRMDL